MKPITKESLLIIGIGAISTGVTTIPTDITIGLVLVLTGIVVIAARGYLKI